MTGRDRQSPGPLSRQSTSPVVRSASRFQSAERRCADKWSKPATPHRFATRVRSAEDDLFRHQCELPLQRRRAVPIDRLRDAEEIVGEDDGTMSGSSLEGQVFDPKIGDLTSGRRFPSAVTGEPERLRGCDDSSYSAGASGRSSGVSKPGPVGQTARVSWRESSAAVEFKQGAAGGLGRRDALGRSGGLLLDLLHARQAVNPR